MNNTFKELSAKAAQMEREGKLERRGDAGRKQRHMPITRIMPTGATFGLNSALAATRCRNKQ